MWGCKLGAVVLLAAVGLFGAYIPIVLQKCKIERFVCVLNTFAAGAFLGLALFHIMPEAAETLEKEEIFIYVGKIRTPFNIAFLLIFIGYVVILLCEQVLTPGEDSDNGASPRESEPATPRDIEDGKETAWDWKGRDGESRHRRKTDEVQKKVTMVSAPAVAAAKYECESGEKVLYCRRTGARTRPEDAAGADNDDTTQGAVMPGVKGGHQLALIANSIKEDTSNADEARSCSSSSRRESLIGHDLKGGGCGLGYPCCLLAAAAAREAASKQASAGTGNFAATAVGREGTPEYLKTYDVEEDRLKTEKKVVYAPSCCVLQQRQKHPRDSTRASAAGSDTDEAEYKEETGMTELVELARDRPTVGEEFGMKKTFRGDVMLKQELLSVAEALYQQDRKERGFRGEGEQECEKREAAATEEQSCCARIDMRQPTFAAAADVTGLGVCGSSSSTTLYHPSGKRMCCCLTACEEAAAATRDTATTDVGCGNPDDLGRAATTAGKIEEGGRDKRGLDVAVAVRDILQKDKLTREVKQTGHGDCQGGCREQKGYMHKWWGGLWRCRGSRQQQKKEGKYIQKTRKRWRFPCTYLWPSFCFSLPVSKHVSGGAFFLMAALAIHGLFEGFVVGAEGNIVSLWIITSVIAAHKWAESLLLMTQFMERRLSTAWAWVLMSIFVASSPLGIIVGACLSSENRVAAGICNALGAGTLLFVAAEVSTKVFTGERKHRVLQLLMYCAGAGMVFALNLLDIALESGAFSGEEG